MANHKKDLRVTVTQKDIARGIKGDGHKCPIALAAKRALGTQANVWACLDIRCGNFVWSLSATANKFMHNFDFKISRVKPFSFIAKHIDEPANG